MWSCLRQRPNRLHSRERGSLSYRVKHAGDGHESVKDNHSMRRPQRVQHNSTAPQRSVTQTLSGLLHRKCEIKQPRHLDLTPAVRSRCLGCFSIRNAACGLAETGATQRIKFMTAETPPLLDFQYSVRTLTRSLICNKKKSVCIAAAPWTSRCRPPAKEMSSCGVAASPPFTRSLFHSKSLWGRQTTSLLTLLGNLTLQHVIVHIVVLTKTSVIIIGLWKGTKSSPLSPAYLLSWKWDSKWRSRRLATNKTCKWRLYALNAYHKTHKGKCKETLKREAMEVKSAVGRKWWVSFNRRFRPVWWRVEGEWSRWWICYKPACDCSTVSN